MLFFSGFRKVSERNQNADSKGPAREQQGGSKETARFNIHEPAMLKLFRYDKLNRIKRMRTAAHHYDAPGWESVSDNFATDYAYDRNGNLLSLRRKDNFGQLMHDITYRYLDNTKNRLSGITATGLNSGTYQYDALGNLVRDNAEGLAVGWNAMGKVDTIRRNGDILSTFRYSPTGQRQVKTDSSSKTFYIHDATGNVMCVYKLHGDTLTATERYLYGSKRLGMLEQQVWMTANSIGLQDSNTIGIRVYEFTDHLGNVTYTAQDRKRLVQDSYGQLQFIPFTVTYTDYYPFGYPMQGRSFTMGRYRYFFNGQEADNEVLGDGALHAFEYRMHDTRIGRFWSVDPLAGKFPWNSAYVFAENRVIWARELEGLEAWTVNRNWHFSDIANFALFSETQIRKYEETHVKDDCANFAYRLIVDYAFENNLPLALKSKSGRTFDSEDKIYTNYARYLKDVLNNLSAKDIMSNTFNVSQSETQAGDVEVLKYERYRGNAVNFLHVVIFASTEPVSVVMGNDPPKELDRYWNNWPRNKLKDENVTKWIILSGKYNSRWNMLNIKYTDPNEEEHAKDRASEE